MNPTDIRELWGRLTHRRVRSGRRLVSSRGLLSAEFIFGWYALATGLAGAVGTGSLHKLLCEAGVLIPWTVIFCGVGPLLGTTAAVVWFNENASNERIKHTSAARMWLSALLCFGWVYVFRLIQTHDLITQALSVGGAALLGVPFCAASFFCNRDVVHTLGKTYDTPEQVLDRRRHS